ncbi:hypothetical protein GC102_08220 [Paenibacillus sp. LMG 31460]|uniref:Uncharacterized protein n=1 Tax=Paenibacillus germinis TaxID=2654979 RepID=A0ABX1YXU2_9BACL|nr:hypothetical protein [Paenibacillus germinis]NOU85758.1 hypothetical protein [Paenibacillus germinis]
MKWNQINNIKRFTPLVQLSFPKLHLTDRPLYYLGSGFMLSYTNRQFKIEGYERVEFGEKGEYALGMYYFKYRKELEQYMNLTLPFQDEVFGGVFEIVKGIAVGDTYLKVKNKLSCGYQIDETRRLKDGDLIFQNANISWKDFRFFFFERSNKSELTGFQLTF